MPNFFNMRRDDNRDYAQAIKDRFAISSVIGEAVRLIGRNGRYMACCPFHDDSTPSLSVNDEDGFFNCFGCGAGGDVIGFIQQYDGVGFADACRKLVRGYDPVPAERIVLKDGDAERSRIARNIWNSSSPTEGTPAAAYLEGRGLPIEFIAQQEDLRFHRLSFDHSTRKHPALIAAARNREGEVVAIQRIYLTEDGEKLAPDCKRTLGVAKGAAIRLTGLNAKVGGTDHIHICEGVEDGASIAGLIEDATVWVSMGASNLANLDLPPACTTVTIATDNDDAGERAAERASAAFIKAGKQVLLYSPPAPFKDWNEYLMHWEFTTEVFGNDLPWRYIDEEDCYDENNNLKTLPDIRDLGAR